jgi:hypothetical protein
MIGDFFSRTNLALAISQLNTNVRNLTATVVSYSLPLDVLLYSSTGSETIHGPRSTVHGPHGQHGARFTSKKFEHKISLRGFHVFHVFKPSNIKYLNNQPVGPVSTQN